MKSLTIYGVLLAMVFIVSGCSTSRSVTTTSEKMKIDPYTGTWSYEVFETPMGTVTGQMIINRMTEGYEAHLESELGETPIYNLSLQDNSIEGTFDYEGYQISVTGNFDGDSFDGQMGADYMIFPMKAERKKELGKPISVKR